MLLRFPFTGRWRAQNSPADRVPSHGTDLLGSTYAIDFVAVDARGRSAPPAWSAAFGTEPPDRFLGFGAPILAPLTGRVVVAEDGEPDHEARRSPFSRLAYAFTQGERLRAGARGVAGNHVAIEEGGAGRIVLLAHLQRGSLLVRVGDLVAVGDRIGSCGNSGNSTEPHVHVQACDTTEWSRARGIPIAFAREDARADGWLPRNGSPFEVPG